MVIPLHLVPMIHILCTKTDMLFKPMEITCRNYSKYDPKYMNDDCSSSDSSDIYPTDNDNSVREVISYPPKGF